MGGSLTLDFCTSASLLLLGEEDEIFDLFFTDPDRLLLDNRGFFSFEDAETALARDLLVRLVAAFCERVEDWTLASSLDAFEEEDTTDLESAQTEVDDDAPTAADFMLDAVDFTDLSILSFRFIMWSTFMYEKPGGSD